MIRKKEIEQLAEQHNVARSTIDKDWVLGHFIDAIFSVKECRESLVFKGGTCLRKCYFPDYRFSEDLDFTSTNPDFVLDAKLLAKITALVTERTGIPLHIQEVSPLMHKDALMGYAAIIKFWGADHQANQAPPPPARWATSVKIEITLHEVILFKQEDRPASHPYSDKLSEAANSIPCYALNEVITEKLRALIQRSYTAPRDFYDLWYLNNHIEDIDWPGIVAAFHEKMAFKGLEFTGVEQMINEENDKSLRLAWKNSLGHQIQEEQLPAYEEVRAELTELFERIFAA